MSSAAKSELAALFIAAKQVVPLCQTLIKMGCPQPRLALQMYNSTADGVTNNTRVPKRTKAMDMIFHWLHCQYSKNQFYYYWAPGISNLADYSTKNHPPL